MASTLEAGQIVWRITGDNSGLNRALTQSEKRAKKTGQTFFSLKGIILGVFSVAAIRAVGRWTKALIGAASDAEEVANKFGVVFKGIEEEANSLAQNLADNYLLSRTEAKKLLSDTGDLLTGFGVQGDAALELSNRVQILAADLASFSNVSGGVAFASEALTKGLFGETEQMKSLGIVINQNSREFKDLVKQKMSDEGLTLQQAKAYAILEIATQQSGNAIGDVARSMASFANQSRIAESRIANLQESLGKALLPVATLAVTSFNEFAKSLDESATAFSDFVTNAENAQLIADVVGNIAGAFSALKVLALPILEGLEVVFAGIAQNVMALGQVLGSIISTVAQFTLQFQVLKTIIGALIEPITNFVKGLTGVSEEGGTAAAVFAGLSVAVNLVGAGFKILGLFAVATISTLKNLVLAVTDSAKAFTGFYDVVRGEKTFDELADDISSIPDNFSNAGAAIQTEWKNTIDNASSVIDGFNEQTRATFEESQKAFAESSAGTSEFIKNVLVQTAQEVQKANTETATSGGEAIKKFAGVTETAFEKIKSVVGEVSNITSSVTSSVTGIAGSVSGLIDALNEQAIDFLDKQRVAALSAAGVAEESAVQVAERELEEAQKVNDGKTIIEKEQALKKAKINEDFEKRKAQIEYQGQMTSWGFKLGEAIATAPLTIINALTTGYGAGFPAGLVLGPLLESLAVVATGIQIAAIAASKPSPPSFQQGGIVPGSSFSGDNVPIQANSGEMVLTQQQQANLFEQANGGVGGQEMYRAIADRQTTWDEIFRASKNGELFISERAVTAK
jgi:hypothetical protein